MSKQNPFIPEQPEFDMPGPQMGFELSPEGATVLNVLREELIADGEDRFNNEYSVRWMRQQFGDDRILEGLAKLEGKEGQPMKEFVKHSWRYQMGGYYEPGIQGGETDVDSGAGMVEIPAGPDNLRQDGSQRRPEKGDKLSLATLRKRGIDPSKVLYYRATQPSTTPKPEYYWTSDSYEVRAGLQRELGAQINNAIVLASTLEEINKNGGLIDDINDDQGIAVRQIGLTPFDQRRALFSFARKVERK